MKKTGIQFAQTRFQIAQSGFRNVQSGFRIAQTQISTEETFKPDPNEANRNAIKEDAIHILKQEPGSRNQNPTMSWLRSQGLYSILYEVLSLCLLHNHN